MNNKIKLTLNDQNIKALKPALKGLRKFAWDDVVPGFCVRVTDNGSKSFALSAKLPGMTNTTVLHINKVGDITLKAARDVAREWKRLINEENKDPRTVVHATETALVKEVASVEGRRFCNVFAAFKAHKQAQVKTGALKKDYCRQMTNYLARHCLPAWGDRQYAAVTAEDIADVARDCFATNGAGASRTLLSAIKTLDSWACSNGKATASAAAIVDPKHICGEKPVRERDLSAAELKKVWIAARYARSAPEGEIYQLLILTGCRLNEVARAKWAEVDLEAKLWTIPKGRMKMKKPHEMPLTSMMIKVLKSVKRGAAGDYIFSRTDGRSPYRISGRAKNRINKAAGFDNWRNHDLRRTMRTMCSGLSIPEDICERMLAHTKKDPYNKHQYLDEKRDGFERWNTELARIVGPQLTVVKRAA